MLIANKLTPLSIILSSPVKWTSHHPAGPFQKHRVAMMICKHMAKCWRSVTSFRADMGRQNINTTLWLSIGLPPGFDRHVPRFWLTFPCPLVRSIPPGPLASSRQAYGRRGIQRHSPLSSTSESESERGAMESAGYSWCLCPDVGPSGPAGTNINKYKEIA